MSKKIVVLTSLFRGKKKFINRAIKLNKIKPNNPLSTKFNWIWILEIFSSWYPELIKKIDDKNKFKKRKTIVSIIVISVYYIEK